MDEKSFVGPGAVSGPSISPVSQKPSRELIVKIVIGVVIAVVVLAGIFLIVRSLMSNPDIVIKRMLSNMKKVKIIRSEIEIDFALIDEDATEGVNVSLGFNMDSDVTSRENPKSSMGFDVSFSAPVPVPGQISPTTMGFQIIGESRTIGETSYLKLDTLDIPDELEFFLMMFGIDKSGLEKQWIRLEEKDLESLGLEKPGRLSPEERLILEEKISNILKEKKIYYVKEVLPVQEINGKKAYHYLLGIDEENLSEVIKEVFKISLEYMDEESLGMGAPFAAGGIAESVKEMLRKIEGLDIEIWIGKKDKYLYKVNLEKYIDSSALIENSRGKVLVRFSAVFSNFNQSVEIEAPDNFIRFEEIIPSFFPPGFDLFERTPEIYLPPGLEEPTFEYPFEGSILEQGVGLYGFQASLLEILSGFLK